MRVVIDRLENDPTNAVRGAVLAALEAEDAVDVVSIRLLVEQRERLDGSPEGYRAVAEALDLTLILRGKLKKTSEGWSVTLMPFAGGSGRALEWVTFEAESIPKLGQVIKAELWAALEPVIERDGDEADAEGAPSAELERDRPPEPGPEDGASDGTSASAPRERSRSTPTVTDGPAGVTTTPRRCPWLRPELGGGAAFRRFDYVGEERGALRGYTLRGAPEVEVAATLSPLSRRRCSLASGLGLHLEYAHLLVAHAHLAGSEFATTAARGGADLRYAAPLGALTLTVLAGYRERRFAVGTEAIPDLRNRSLAFGLAPELRVRWLLLAAEGQYRHVLAPGELGAAWWFPALDSWGFVVGAAVGVAPLDAVDLRLGATWTSFRHTFATPTGVAPSGTFLNGVAAGAKDDFLETRLTVAFHVPGRRHPPP